MRKDINYDNYIKRYIVSYDTHNTMESAADLAQCILDLDLLEEYPQYKTLCNHMLLEGLCYDIGFNYTREFS